MLQNTSSRLGLKHLSSYRLIIKVEKKTIYLGYITLSRVLGRRHIVVTDQTQLYLSRLHIHILNIDANSIDTIY